MKYFDKSTFDNCQMVQTRLKDFSFHYDQQTPKLPLFHGQTSTTCGCGTEFLFKRKQPGATVNTFGVSGLFQKIITELFSFGHKDLIFRNENLAWSDQCRSLQNFVKGTKL